MKVGNEDFIEQLFSEGLSDAKLADDVDLSLPDSVWSRIEDRLPPAPRRRPRAFLGIITLCLSALAIYFTAFTKDAVDGTKLGNLTKAEIAKSSTEGAIRSRNAEFEPEAIGTKPDADISGTEKHPDRVTGPFTSLPGATEKSSSFIALDTVGSAATRDDSKSNREIALAETFNERNVPAATSLNSVIKLRSKIRLLDEILPTESSQMAYGYSINASEEEVLFGKYWMIEGGVGFRSSDYFIQGNFSIDPNTQFSVDHRWSTAAHLNFSRWTGKLLSFDVGLHYIPTRTMALYIFSIPYSSSDENINGNIAVRSIKHNIPSVNGGLSATSILERNLGDMISEGEEIVLEADVNQMQKILVLPMSAKLRLLTRGSFLLNLGVGLNLNMQLSKLEVEVGDLRSNETGVRYDDLLLSPTDVDTQKSFYGGYHFTGDFAYFIDSKGTFINASLHYSNAFSPSFTFENVNVFPRMWGVSLGVGKKF